MVTTSIGDDYGRFKDSQKSPSEDSSSEFKELIESMRARGLIEKNGLELISLVPSYIGPE